MTVVDKASGASPGWGTRVPAIIAVVAAMTLAVVLAVRPIASYDVGYHLAYGEHFLNKGEIVQTNRFVYTRLRPDILADPNNLGPGCRYDKATDTYHFVNANWLSQVIMASAHRAGGMTGLGILQAALIAAIFLTIVATMRRSGVAWHWIAPAIVLTALAGYERFNLRPEVFGYLILVLQWYLLVELSAAVPSVAVPATAKRARWRLVGVIILQILAVNLHSYFILGVALVGAMFADALLRRLWARFVTHPREKDPTGRLKWLGIATAGVVLACLLNPWFVRGAIMPIQTLLFMAKHHIGDGSLWLDWIRRRIRRRIAEAVIVRPTYKVDHPWATIGEFFTPFAEGVRYTRVITAYYVVLCLAGVAGVVALLRRRWGWLLVLVGMTVVSTRMRRNIAPAAMIIVPLALIILTDGWNWLRGYFKTLSPRRPKFTVAVAIITLAAAGWWTVSVMTNRFYFSERRGWRFWWGVSDITVPLEAAGWINDHKPTGKVFCDYGTSSNLMYFIQPEYEVPILTNTWAYPPYVMKQVRDITTGRCDFAPVVAQYDISTVVLRLSHDTAPLIKTLAVSPDWAVAHVGVSHVVFLRRSGANAELAKSQGMTKKNFDISGFIKSIFVADPLPAHSLHIAASLLDRIGWGNHAITVWRTCLRQEENYYEAMNSLGRRLALRGISKMLLMQKYHSEDKPAQADLARREGLSDWAEAEQLFKDALKIDPNYEDASRNLRLLHKQMAAFKRGVIIVPQMQ